mgnify:CR=1 FL=1
MKTFIILIPVFNDWESLKKLISFKSTTFQNDKEKYVNLKYDEKINRLIIDGSSYKGEANLDCVIGNWWNHKILEANQQISPLSGSLKDQVVKFIGYENITLYGKNFSAAHYKLKSKDDNLPKDKKLDFDTTDGWYNWWLMNKQFFICLLYTSDAADE